MWFKLITSKAFRSSRSQMFYKIGFLENFCKIHRETPMLDSLFNKVARLKGLHHKCCALIFVKFSRTPITPQNQTTLQRKQICKVT